MYGKKIFASFFDNANLELLGRGRIAFKYTEEVLRFRGVVRLATRFKFVKRDELWSTVGSKYMPAVDFWRTSMGRDRFKEILSAHIYSKQPQFHPSNLISEQYQWVLVDDHVANFNKKLCS